MPSNKLMLVNVVQPGPFKGQELRREVRNVLRRQLTQMRQAFEATTEFWATRVEFKDNISMAGGVVFIEVTTDNPLYYLLDIGAEAHYIDAYNFPTLVFRNEYTAKTTPGELPNNPSEHGGEFRRKPTVKHPGFKARGFEETVRALIEDKFYEETQKAVDNFAKKSGHYMD